MAFIPFRDIVEGTVLPSVQYEIDQKSVDEYAEAVGAPPSPDGVALPTYCVVLLKEVRTLLPAPPGGIHASQEFEFFEPIRVGDVVTVTSTVASTFVRNGRNNVVLTTEFVREDGAVVATGTARRIWAA